MTEMVETAAIRATPDALKARLRRRYAAERRFRALGLGAVLLSLSFLGVLLVTIVSNGITAFVQTQIRLEVAFDPAVMGLGADRSADALRSADYGGLVKAAIQSRFPDVESRAELRQLTKLISVQGGGEQLQAAVLADPGLIGSTRALWLIASPDVDMVMKGHVGRDKGAEGARLNDTQLGWLETLEQTGDVALTFNTLLFTRGDSREPELAGLWGAVVGSLYSLSITLLICFPIGVASAVYLEEFAPKNRLTDLIEVNINNLAAVPSVVFGLLGLAIFLNTFGLPRSAPLVGGLVLALISLPTIIIAGRAALKAVPPSIREAALGLGASRLQVTADHVLPLAMPGVLTGTILGMAHALGETAPLLMIGMVAFIVDIPGSPLDPAAVLPVQVYLWADSPERAFVERTSAAIMVLLAFLALMNLAAILLRKKFERRW
ncbi:MAG: phosphate ABC transporter permease PstA [Magnetospirillum sp.]|nr:phosphate ABC transporter permease PstA [Magnetospirillum sp.]